MGTSKRLAALYDRYGEHDAILTAAKSGPLQSLSPRELALDRYALTIYPRPQQRVKAWVRFGPEPVRVAARVMRSTPTAVGIEFTAKEHTFRCWVWGNAIELDDAEGE